MPERVQFRFARAFSPITGILIDLYYGVPPVSRPTVKERNIVLKIGKRMVGNEALEEIGRGGDMVAYSRPDLNFVLKFPYDPDKNETVPTFSPKVRWGYFLATRFLKGIMAPTIDYPGIFTDPYGYDHPTSVLIQHKIRTVDQLRKDLSRQGRSVHMTTIENLYIETTQEMWRRGILDKDPNWEENYGLTKKGKFVLSDVGDLSDRVKDFAYFEGLPRKKLYEQHLQRIFTRSNFRAHFRRTNYNGGYAFVDNMFHLETGLPATRGLLT